jgi:hypothetical protein
MKKLFLLGLVVSMGLVVALTSCGGGGKIGGVVQGETFKNEGWVDKDTYRIAAAGVSNSKLTNKIQRRESAKRAAILNAQYQVLEKFKGSTIEGAAGMSDFESTGIAVAQEVQGFIKGGSVLSATYDDEDNCEVIYEVKGKDLKKKASTANWK